MKETQTFCPTALHNVPAKFMSHFVYTESNKSQVPHIHNFADFFQYFWHIYSIKYDPNIARNVLKTSKNYKTM
jgi:hypothetical protein